ncbi:MAG: hypothetical protein IKT26_04765, partial [Bacteroidaceae bacterium]|nr:hypothetical protein [Bacteroidaceae bacterium]
ILFQGDSITDAGRDKRNYHDLGAGYPKFAAQHIREAEMLCLIGGEDQWEWAEQALQAEHPRRMIVISDIDTEGGSRWKHLIKNEQVRMSFDLGHIGIICCEKRLNKQDYIISY